MCIGCKTDWENRCQSSADQNIQNRTNGEFQNKIEDLRGRINEIKSSIDYQLQQQNSNDKKIIKTLPKTDQLHQQKQIQGEIHIDSPSQFKSKIDRIKKNLLLESSISDNDNPYHINDQKNQASNVNPSIIEQVSNAQNDLYTLSYSPNQLAERRYDTQITSNQIAKIQQENLERVNNYQLQGQESSNQPYDMLIQPMYAHRNNEVADDDGDQSQAIISDRKLILDKLAYLEQIQYKMQNNYERLSREREQDRQIYTKTIEMLQKQVKSLSKNIQKTRKKNSVKLSQNSSTFSSAVKQYPMTAKASDSQRKFNKANFLQSRTQVKKSLPKINNALRSRSNSPNNRALCPPRPVVVDNRILQSTLIQCNFIRRKTRNSQQQTNTNLQSKAKTALNYYIGDNHPIHNKISKSSSTQIVKRRNSKDTGTDQKDMMMMMMMKKNYSLSPWEQFHQDKENKHFNLGDERCLDMEECLQRNVQNQNDEVQSLQNQHREDQSNMQKLRLKMTKLKKYNKQITQTFSENIRELRSSLGAFQHDVLQDQADTRQFYQNKVVQLVQRFKEQKRVDKHRIKRLQHENRKLKQKMKRIEQVFHTPKSQQY